MASLPILKSNFSALSSNPRARCFRSEFKSEVSFRRRCFTLPSHRTLRHLISKSFRISCKVQEGDNQSNGEEPPESLFMKELKRRGMTPTSLLEESSRSSYGEEGIKFMEEDGGFSRRNVVSTDSEQSLSNQRETSMALNSEGLEGLIPRAKLLLTLGGTFFFGFWPLILITIGFFSALYLYFGPSFIHDPSETLITIPRYVDPYTLLEDERISQTSPPLN